MGQVQRSEGRRVCCFWIDCGHGSESSCVSKRQWHLVWWVATQLWKQTPGSQLKVSIHSEI